MKKPLAVVLLAVFGNLMLCAMWIFITFIRFGNANMFIVAAIVMALHIVGSMLSGRHFERSFELPVGKYIMYGTMPALGLNALSLLASFIILGTGVLGDVGYALCFIALFSLGYTVLYLIFFAAAAALFM